MNVLVKLVGAGPGDPDLLTVKAVKAIAWASVILIDDLVNKQVLEHATPNARIIHVGKRGGCASTPQAFIERLMVAQAQAGERVVRLKGGDPLVFGRAAEEMAALRAANIGFDIIPGITSALAAAASLQVSLTNRDHGPGMAFITAHRRLDQPTSTQAAPTEWPALLRSGLTLAIYMGAGRVQEIQAQALAAGLPGDMPVAVVQGASTSSEKRVLTSVAYFAQAMQDQGIASPALLMIGSALGTIDPRRQTHYASLARSASVVKESA
jgi:uroporphyrin-III C-methyltransferase